LSVNQKATDGTAASSATAAPAEDRETQGFCCARKAATPPGKIVAIDRLQQRGRGDSRAGARIHLKQGHVVVYLPEGAMTTGPMRWNE